MTEPDATSEGAEETTDAADVEPTQEAAATAPSGDPFAAVRETWGFPSFAESFPHDPELAALVTAFAAGDYATVRTGAPALAARTDNEDVRRAARLLRARIEPDPAARWFVGLTAALLVFLFAWWAAHDGAEHARPAPPAPPPAVEFVK